ncbi:MAG: glycosyltransferase family 39 protein [Candidatus Harrisonbacteria bacterium]|nr:glycosyltransferase family 39 protein [Candidatus Harrisonbacteria bacterium]
MRRKIIASIVLGLLLASAGFYLIDLGKRPFDDYDEAIYAQVVREMLQNKNYLTLTYFDQTWFEKPPLQFWLMAISAEVFGLNEFSVRLPSALFGVTAVVLTFLIILHLTKNIWLSIFGGLAVLGMPLFLAAARHARMDVPVTSAILSAFYFYLLGLKNPKFLISVAPCVAIGILLKSVIGLLAIPIIVIWSFYTKQWGWFKNRYFWIGAIIALLIVAPWHIYEIAKFGGAFWNDYFGYHILQRAAQNVLNSGISLPYFFWVTWKYLQPWSGIFIPAVLATGFVWIKSRSQRKTLELASLLSAILFIFFIFAVSKTKLLTYFTPLYPLLAVFFAILAERFWRVSAKWVLLFLVLIGLWGSAREAFVSQKIYHLDYSFDEKNIGLLLNGSSGADAAFTFQWDHHNSLRYYSQREIQPLQFNSSNQPDPPFWLILPTELLEENPDLKNMTTPFSGQYLTLVRFKP